MMLPLKSETTACGHITLVGAQLLGIPLVITRSKGVADYVEDGVTATLVAAGDAELASSGDQSAGGTSGGFCRSCGYGSISRTNAKRPFDLA